MFLNVYFVIPQSMLQKIFEVLGACSVAVYKRAGVAWLATTKIRRHTGATFCDYESYGSKAGRHAARTHELNSYNRLQSRLRSQGLASSRKAETTSDIDDQFKQSHPSPRLDERVGLCGDGFCSRL